MTKVSVAQLSAVPTTLLIALMARARGAVEFPELGFTDPVAEAISRQIDYDPEVFAHDKRAIYCVVRRTQIFRSWLAEFFRQHSHSTGANLGCGLTDYFQWIDNGSNRWINFDLPETLRVRERLLPTRERCENREGSLTSDRWWDDLAIDSTRPCVLLAEGVLIYLQPEEVRRVLTTFAERAAPGSRFLLDHMCWLGVGQARFHPSVRKTEAQFHWGPRRYADLTSPHPRLRIVRHQRVMRTKGWLYAYGEAIFRSLAGIDFYAVTELTVT